MSETRRCPECGGEMQPIAEYSRQCRCSNTQCRNAHTIMEPCSRCDSLVEASRYCRDHGIEECISALGERLTRLEAVKS